MLKELTLFGEIDKVQIAIDRIKEFDPSKIDKNKVYILPFSGGKDSLACYILAKMAGIKFIAIKAPTPDPPELQQYVHKNFKVCKTREEAVMEYPYTENKVYIEPFKRFSNRTKRKEFIGRPKTMFNLIKNRKMPPTRVSRYCCSDLKENVGDKGDFLIMGVRREESITRSKRGIVSFWMGKTCINPIVDWTQEEVWELIKGVQQPYCCLYDEGWERLGCVGCPLSSNQKKELERWPQFYKAYVRCFDEMLNNLEDKSRCDWKNGEDVMKWWLGECQKDRSLEGQCSMFDE